MKQGEQPRDPKRLHLASIANFLMRSPRGKKTEYREDSQYWRSRLEGRLYTEILFRNGFLKSAPTMRVECLGIRKRNGVFAIKLGQVLAISNYS